MKTNQYYKKNLELRIILNHKISIFMEKLSLKLLFEAKQLLLIQNFVK